MKYVPYIGIVLLILIILLQNRGCSDNNIVKEPKIDTVIVYKTIHDTISGKPVYIKTKIDTSIWMKKEENIPDTTYKGLLFQYKKLGNSHFSTNVFKTDFKIADYGSVSITDSIRENILISSSIITDLKIPTTTITIEKETPPKRQLFIGIELAGYKKVPLSDVYGGFLLKTKKDKIYGASLGFNGGIKYKGSLYFPIKLK